MATLEWKTPRGNRIKLLTRDGTNDWNTMSSIITHDEYDLAKLPRLSGTALDIGGYLGGVGAVLAIDNPGLQVVIVEPVPDNVEMIHQLLALNGLASRVEVIAGAVGGPADPSELEVAYGFWGSETATHHRFVGNSSMPGLAPPQCLTKLVPRWTLSALLARVGPVVFAKVDCEGGEFGFLSEQTANAQVATIHGEWHPL